MSAPKVVARKAQVDLDWADGHYTFRLPIDQLMELQENTNAGPKWIETRLANGTWIVEDIIHTIRLALIGGGTKPDVARKLVQRYVEARPLMESVPVAHVIIQATLIGVKDESLKKAEEGTASRTPLSPTEKSGSPTSTASAEQWGSTSVN